MVADNGLLTGFAIALAVNLPKSEVRELYLNGATTGFVGLGFGVRLIVFRWCVFV